MIIAWIFLLALFPYAVFTLECIHTLHNNVDINVFYDVSLSEADEVIHISCYPKQAASVFMQSVVKNRGLFRPSAIDAYWRHDDCFSIDCVNWQPSVGCGLNHSTAS